MVDGYYYPGSRINSFWAKQSLLFFSRINVLVPPGHSGPRRVFNDYSWGHFDELLDNDLVVPLAPDKVMSQQLSERIVEAIFEEVLSNPSEYISERDLPGSFDVHRLKLGYGAEPALFQMLVEGLIESGVHLEYASAGFWRVPPKLRALINLVHATTIPDAIADATGRTIRPVTNYPDVNLGVSGVTASLFQARDDEILSFDCEALDLDVSRVPVDEIVDFRSRHSEGLRHYLLDTHKFAKELSDTPDYLRAAVLRERKQEIDQFVQKMNRDGREGGWSAVGVRAAKMLGLLGTSLYLAKDGLDLGGAALFASALLELAGSRNRPTPQESRLEFSALSYPYDARLALRGY